MRFVNGSGKGTSGMNKFGGRLFNRNEVAERQRPAHNQGYAETKKGGMCLMSRLVCRFRSESDGKQAWVCHECYGRQTFYSRAVG